MKTKLLLITSLMLSFILTACIELEGGVVSCDYLDATFSTAPVIGANGQFRVETLTITVETEDGTILVKATESMVTNGSTYSFRFPYSQSVPGGTLLTVKAVGYNYNQTFACSENIVAVDTTAITSQIYDPQGDADSDGVINSLDNCLLLANPGQENGWGSPAGDACDMDYYDSKTGVKTFQQLDGTFHIHGACRFANNRTECPVVGAIPPSNLDPAASPQRFQTADSSGWYVDVYFLGELPNNQHLYQINIYNEEGVLQDDHQEVIVNADGVAIWRARPR